MKLRSISVFVAGLTAAVASFAVQPQNGFWAIDGELTGQPGRGFQIDVQGETLVFSYYGYRNDGSATFYLSSGAYNVAEGKYTGQLYEYKDGTPLGQPFRNGAESGSPGSISLNFINSNKGYMTLPGEGQRAISRFTFSDPSVKFNGKQWDGNIYGRGAFNSDATTFDFSLSNGNLTLTQDSFFSGKCLYTGVYAVKGDEIESNGSYRCSDFSEGSYIAEHLKINADGTYTGVFRNTTADGKSAYTMFHTAR